MIKKVYEYKNLALFTKRLFLTPIHMNVYIYLFIIFEKRLPDIYSIFFLVELGNTKVCLVIMFIVVRSFRSDVVYGSLIFLSLFSNHSDVVMLLRRSIIRCSALVLVILIGAVISAFLHQCSILFILLLILSHLVMNSPILVL